MPDQEAVCGNAYSFEQIYDRNQAVDVTEAATLLAESGAKVAI